ncbi:MAG TPA: DEAD/DEAH box helicase [Acidimicrobiia bacterium]|nr:DEAD/DEAH box helicase [Acidimicrobiia bacterium]
MPVTLDRFTDATRTWFDASFASPTAAQERGWDAIARGDHTLIHAPTGSGKTLAAFLWAIDGLAREPVPDERSRCRVLYVSPMKALAYDVERNLRAPLTGIQNAAGRLGLPAPRITTAMRTGDTPGSERQAMLRHPPDIMITTPESLYLMLTSQAREILRPVRTVIVDEIHSVAGTKRGSHLSLTLERLTALTDTEPQRIGLSATQRPLEDIAAFLGGGTAAGADWQPRPVTIVDAPWDKTLDLGIVVPVADMTRPEETPLEGVADDDGARRSIWPAVYPRLLELVLANRSTLLFVNSRSLAERLAAELNRLAGEELVQSHHGSVSREQRLEIENRLKAGELRGVVATSTLELGIDMAAIDLVVLVESPSSVARGLQRVGRAGHQVGAPSVARIFPKHRGDLLETAVVVDRMLHGAIEATRIPQNPLDVLAQQIVAIVAVEPTTADELYTLVRRAAPYGELARSAFDAVLDMLAGRYPSDEFAELRPRIIWDRIDGTVEARRNAKLLAVTNPGTIPDRGLYTVTLPDGGKVGELDEEMVYESRPGDVFVLGSTSWKIDEITHDRVIVHPAPGESAARMPFWHGDTLGRPLELGRAVGAFIRKIGGKEPDAARSTLRDDYHLDAWAADNLAAFIEEERAFTGTLPTDRTIVVERFRDEIGDWRMVVLSPFGARVHAPWALAARHLLRTQVGSEVDVMWSDDGIVFRFPDVDEPPDAATLILDPQDVDELLLEEVADSALFTARFREAAARALLLPRRRPGSRTPLWLQRRRAASLLDIAKRFASFPIVLETYREVLQDHFDVPALSEVLRDVAARKVRVREVELAGPSPFASSLMFDFIASFMYEYDAPIAEKRAAALTLDRTLLRELLGDPQFRDLLDADVVAAVETELQRLAPERRIGSADALHDALRDLGPLTHHGIAARSEPAAAVDEWLETLHESRRIAEVRLHGEPRIAAIEDLARLRDALGVAPPLWTPPSLLEPPEDPLGDVVGRFARTHGPFAADAAAAELGLPLAAVNEVLQRLAGEGRVSAGAYRPGGDGQEWVDSDVLRRLRRRSLAVLRAEVEAVDPEVHARFLPLWHGVGSGAAHSARLMEVVRQIQGTAIPASILERDVLRQRLAYQPGMLDMLLASGEVVWIGRGPLGASDGRVALYLRHQVPLLHQPSHEDPPQGELHDLLRSHLEQRGASFFNDLYVAAEGGPQEAVLEALWDLVWAGEVTNDTLAPLRAYGAIKGKRRSGRPAFPTAAPPAGSGRWYLARDLLAPGEPIVGEQRAKAVADQLLERHGVVTRDAVLAENIPGGFSGLYPVFAAMEDAGRVRRGYFIEGRGGSQFALPGAVDRLRTATSPEVTVLAAADPANAYGAALPWPEHPSGRLARRAGAYVLTHDGALIGFLERGGRTLLTFDADSALLATALASFADRTGTRLILATVDGAPAASGPMAETLRAAGFTPGYRGLTYGSTRRRA